MSVADALYAHYYPHGVPPNLTDDAGAANCSPHGHTVSDGVVPVFGSIYPLIFLTAVTGNLLVVFVVVSNKDMQTVTNVFIANLAASDLLVNFTSLWLTPVYIFMGRWIWGRPLCYGLPLFQGVATYNSTFTLMAIAIDRYIVILHPLRARISKSVAVAVIVSIWCLSFFLSFPYALNMVILKLNGKLAEVNATLVCEDPGICMEDWPWPGLRKIYGIVAMILQFVFPFLVSALCYTLIWMRIAHRGGMAQVSNADAEALRRRRLLKMLIAMVVIFALCWLPVNILNVYRDMDYPGSGFLRDAIAYNFSDFFLAAHVICMTATAWNPILFAWMNENFQREFKAVLPCFPRHSSRLHRPYSIRQSPGRGHGRGHRPSQPNPVRRTSQSNDFQRHPVTVRGVIVDSEESRSLQRPRMNGGSGRGGLSRSSSGHRVEAEEETELSPILTSLRDSPDSPKDRLLRDALGQAPPAGQPLKEAGALNGTFDEQSPLQSDVSL